MVSDTDEDDDDIPLVNNRLEDVTAEVESIRRVGNREKRNADTDTQSLASFGEEAVTEDFVTEGGLVLPKKRGVNFKEDVNHRKQPPDDDNNNNDVTAAGKPNEAQRETPLYKRHSITGTTAIPGSLFGRDLMNQGNKNRQSGGGTVTSSGEPPSKGDPGQKRCCGLTPKQCCILWLVLLIVFTIITIIIVVVLLTRTHDAANAAKSSESGSSSALVKPAENPASNAETAALMNQEVETGQLHHAKEETIRTHYALVGDRPEDDCSLGNHQSPIRIDSDSLKDGLTGQNISFNLVQALHSTKLFKEPLMLVSDADRLFLAGFHHRNIDLKIGNFSLPSSSIIDSPLTRYGFDEEATTFRQALVRGFLVAEFALRRRSLRRRRRP